VGWGKEKNPMQKQKGDEGRQVKLPEFMKEGGKSDGGEGRVRSPVVVIGKKSMSLLLILSLYWRIKKKRSGGC